MTDKAIDGSCVKVRINGIEVKELEFIDNKVGALYQVNGTGTKNHSISQVLETRLVLGIWTKTWLKISSRSNFNAKSISVSVIYDDEYAVNYDCMLEKYHSVHNLGEPDILVTKIYLKADGSGNTERI